MLAFIHCPDESPVLRSTERECPSPTGFFCRPDLSLLLSPTESECPSLAFCRCPDCSFPLFTFQKVSFCVVFGCFLCLNFSLSALQILFSMLSSFLANVWFLFYYYILVYTHKFSAIP
jgi:hypothetical protein